MEDLASLEARLSWQVLKALSPKTAPAEEEFLRARPRVRLDALESYIRGLLAANPEQQHRFFIQAARLDAAYSQPCFQLGKSYWGKKDYRVAAGWLGRVHPGDPHYLEAQFFLGLCNYQIGDYPAAAKCFETVAASVPLNEVYNDLGAAQTRSNLTAAIESFRKALEGDSADPDYRFNLGCALVEGRTVSGGGGKLPRRPRKKSQRRRGCRAARPRRAPGTSASRRRGTRAAEKTNYEETAYRQLKAELHRASP